MAFEENPPPTARAGEIGEQVERFVRDVVTGFENDPRNSSSGHGPCDTLVHEMREKARAAGVLTPHILADGGHLTQRETAYVLRKSGLSPLGPLACNTMAPDEGNMYLIGKVGTEHQKAHFLSRMHAGEVRSAFLMTEPADDNGAGSDPSMLQTEAKPAGNGWVINGRKAFITGYDGAGVGILMARTGGEGRSLQSTMFLIDLPRPEIEIERVLNTIDSSMPGGHSVLRIKDLKVDADAVLGEVGEGFRYAQVRLSPARLSHCMRWLGGCIRAHEIAADYAVRRRAFGKPLIDHEGVGNLLADNLVDLKQCELLVDWCAGVLDTGALGTAESSIAKVGVSEALFRIADRCVQIMGGTGITDDTIVGQMFRETRAFRIYDGPTEVHRWSLAKKIKREVAAGHG
jgi:acyl-CoA dehydrogenase